MEWIKQLKKLDFALLLTVLALFIIGLFAIDVATDSENFIGGDSSSYIFTQLTAFAIGIVGMLIIIAIDYKTLGRYWKLIFILSVISLIIVHIPGIGVVRGGSRRWVDLGFMDLQTSEIAKLGFVIAFAKFLSLKKDRINKPFDLAQILLFLMIPMGLIFAQPDLGQSIVFGVIAAGMIFVAGISLKYVFSIIGAGVLIFPIAWNFFMHDYQKSRIITFLNPMNDPLGEGYHALQSMITIGSGELSGKGLDAENTMTSLNYLPAQWTDFIFSVISEATGFIGAVTVLLLLGLMLARLLRDAKLAK
ncbi:MAG TPA: rod shape-determining protein RodA, partial [Eubacteriaceae bacterium]|nr:rod shape-determining protein RodA [Eubacteriaceae bacterium]